MLNRKNKKAQFGFIAVTLCFLIFLSGCMHFSKQKLGEKPDLSQSRQSWYSAPIDRLSDGFANIVYGPIELIYNLKEEVKQRNPVEGLIPGLLKGVTWIAMREVVGVFEVVTFFVPWKPHLPPPDWDWFQA